MCIRDRGIAGLGAAGAGARELQHGLAELAALDSVILHVGLLADLVHTVVEDLLLGGLLLLGHHGQGTHRALTLSLIHISLSWVTRSPRG